jgi:hypothetical protein
MVNMKKLTLLLCIILLSSTVMAQSQLKSVEFEIGAMSASNIMVKMDATICISDSTLKFTFENRMPIYNIVKYSESFNKYLLSDGIDDFVFTIVEQKGKMKGYDYTYLGLFEIKSKSYTVSYALNKKSQ